MKGSRVPRPLTSSAVVHGTADPRTHRSKSSHCEVGHVSGLKEADRNKPRNVSFQIHSNTEWNMTFWELIV